MSAYPAITMHSSGTSIPTNVCPDANVLWQAPPAYALGLIVTLSSDANLTYTVQVTADQQPECTGFWNNHDVLAGKTVSANSNVAYPITGIRLVVTNYVAGWVNLGIAKWP